MISGRQSSRADQRSSAQTPRCKTPDRSDCPPTLVDRLPVFPLNSSSPPSSPTKVKVETEGEKKRSNQPQGPRPGAPSGGGRGQKAQGWGLGGGKGLLSESQVRLLVGLYYLPHEYGLSGQKLLQDLSWLKANCHLVSANSKKTAPQKVSVCSVQMSC